MGILRILLRIAFTCIAVWLMATYLPQYVEVGGGMRAIIAIGVILALVNATLRVIFDIVTFPLRFISTLLVHILVNAFLLWITEVAVTVLPPDVARFDVKGGWFGWVIVSIAFGVLSWFVRLLSREGEARRG